MDKDIELIVENILYNKNIFNKKYTLKELKEDLNDKKLKFRKQDFKINFDEIKHDPFFHNDLINLNYFDIGYFSVKEISYNKELEFTRIFPKVRASFNLALNIKFTESDNNLDKATMLSYFGLTRFLYVYRALESYRRFIYEYEGKTELINQNGLKNQMRPQVESQNDNPFSSHYIISLINNLRNKNSQCWKDLEALNLKNTKKKIYF